MGQKMSEKRVVKRYKENPFLKEMDITTRKKQVRVRALGKDSDISILNHESGEISGTQLITFKKVDDEEFVKLFAKNIALTFDLTAAGNKALVVLVWTVQYKAIEKDLVALDSFTHDDFLNAHTDKKDKFSIATFKRGIKELEESKIIAKAERPGFYFINPGFVFNGDRIAFTRVIERKKQLDLLEIENK